MERNVIRRLDDPPRILFFSMAQTFVFMLCFMFANFAQAPWLGMGLGVLAAWAISKSSSRYHRAFWRHVIYWFFPGKLALLWLPESHRRAYLR
jgi:type IV conjugative transfer system protein TraL